MHVHIPRRQKQTGPCRWRQTCVCGYSRDVNGAEPGEWRLLTSPTTYRLDRAIKALRALEWAALKPNGQWSCPSCRVIKRGNPPQHAEGCELAAIVYGGYVDR